jgi:hypothetical protein
MCDRVKTVDVISKDGFSPIKYAADANQYDHISLLMSKSTDLGPESTLLCTILSTADTSTKRIEFIFILLQKRIGTRGTFGKAKKTPLMIVCQAVETASADFVGKLLQHDDIVTDINKQDTLTGDTALHVAVRSLVNFRQNDISHELETVEALIEN